MEMNPQCFGVVLFETAHDAIIGEKKIREHLNVALMPIPSQFSAGCGIVLRFELGDAPRMKELLEANRIPGRIVYVDGSGSGDKIERSQGGKGDNPHE